MEAKECSNLAREFNGEKNWCLLKDSHCPLLVKHERYSFNKKNIECDYLNRINGIGEDVGLSSKECRGCKQIFKTDNLRLRYCSNTCRNSAKRKSERESRSRKSLAERGLDI
ncbi:hypothetical protein CEQ83_02180 [Priestia megaterium]|uniref:hypothetical protein n=1 Tax=Priestia megaterium TaxID=1404 RepID=UPI0012A945CD|nr:hypothetical protein [Priestia megaterium]QFY71372.1 hypothetical protein CEQ83_02180 [Priestia megaterium]